MAATLVAPRGRLHSAATVRATCPSSTPPCRSARSPGGSPPGCAATSSPRPRCLDAVVGDDADPRRGRPARRGRHASRWSLALGAAARGGRDRRRARRCPAPGDPLGLGGPPAFNTAALDAGEAVVVRGLRPRPGARPGRRRPWLGGLARAAPRRSRTSGEADRELRRRPARAADALAALDVARWRPEVADELIDLRHRPGRSPPRPGSRRACARPRRPRAAGACDRRPRAGRRRRRRHASEAERAPARALLPLDRAAPPGPGRRLLAGGRGRDLSPRPPATAIASTPDDGRRPAPPKTLLITLTGKDRPGVTSAIFATLSQAGVEVLDIEQIVLRRRLVLGVLVTAPRDWKKLRDARRATGRGARHARRGRPRRRRQQGPPRAAAATSPCIGTPLQGRRDGRGRRPDRRQRRQHRPDRADGPLPGHRDRPARLRRRPRARCARCWPWRPPARASTSPSSPPTCCAAACG